MAPEALGLALAAACVHAVWNVLLARSPDVERVTAAALPVGLVVFAPAAIVWWRVQGAAVPFLVGSSALELAYFALLVEAYRRAELSLVYPLTRGLAPVLVLAASVAFLGTGASAGEVVGVVLVACGIVLVRGFRGGLRNPVELGLTVAIACCIAGYTLVDRYGVKHANPLAYVELVLLGPAVVYPALARRRRLAVAGPRSRAGLLSAVAAGAGMVGAYALVLAALRLASAAAVAAVRESSIVLAVGLAALTLREPVGPRRLAGAAVVAMGVALLATT